MKPSKLLILICLSLIFSCKKRVYLETTYSYSSNPSDIRIKLDSFDSKNANNDYHKALKEYFIDSLRSTIIDSTSTIKNDSIISYTITYADGNNLINKIDPNKAKIIKNTAYREALEIIKTSKRIIENLNTPKGNKPRPISNKISSESFQKYLSDWDGSFPPLKDYIKENINDPSSFEHVQTGYIVRDGWVEVKTIYRAKNGFGALVKEAVIAKASNDGKLLEILSVIN